MEPVTVRTLQYLESAQECLALSRKAQTEGRIRFIELAEEWARLAADVDRHKPSPLPH